MSGRVPTVLYLLLQNASLSATRSRRVGFLCFSDTIRPRQIAGASHGSLDCFLSVMRDAGRWTTVGHPTLNISGAVENAIEMHHYLPPSPAGAPGMRRNSSYGTCSSHWSHVPDVSGVV
jgi:hypothetical protein